MPFSRAIYVSHLALVANCQIKGNCGDEPQYPGTYSRKNGQQYFHRAVLRAMKNMQIDDRPNTSAQSTNATSNEH